MKASALKSAAKWIFFLWTALCVAGVTRSLRHTVPAYRAAHENDERESAQIALVMGGAAWLGVWGVVALPCVMAWLTAGKSAETGKSDDSANDRR